jgi:acyl-CoA synthetase (AMP-forming)/AMP-acid ligase II
MRAQRDSLTQEEKRAERGSLMKVHIGYFLARMARTNPNRVALVYEGLSTSYRELNSKVNRLSHSLVNLGLRPGDKVATLFLNCPELVVTYFAVLKAGGVLVPLNARLRPEELFFMIDHSDAKFLVSAEAFGQAVASIRERLPSLQAAIFAGKDLPVNTESFSDLVRRGSEHEPKVDVSEDNEFAIIYTAGTTGRSKGVLLTHRNFIWGMLNQNTSYLPPPDRSLQVFPLSHNAGLIGLCTRIMRGDTIVLIRSAELELILQTIQREKISFLGLVPTLSNALSQAAFLDRYDRSSVQLVGSGAAILPPETKKRMSRLFPSAGFFDTYGMTECSGPITTLNPVDFFRKEACVGKGFPHHEVRVVGEDGCDVRPGEVGEIIVSGPTVMKQYYKSPEETEQALREGYLFTGDLAKVDDEGYVHIVDRKKDLIITGGYNVYPKEVEDILSTHPKVMEAAVIGIPHEKWGETIRAVVVPLKEEKVTEEEIIEFCKDRLASYKKPTSVVFVDALPKSPVGKVLRRVLKEKSQKEGAK